MVEHRQRTEPNLAPQKQRCMRFGAMSQGFPHFPLYVPESRVDPKKLSDPWAKPVIDNASLQYRTIKLALLA